MKMLSPFVDDCEVFVAVLREQVRGLPKTQRTTPPARRRNTSKRQKLRFKTGTTAARDPLPKMFARFVLLVELQNSIVFTLTNRTVIVIP